MSGAVATLEPHVESATPRSRDRLHELMAALLEERVSSGRVLDVGCGDGTLSQRLRRRFDVHCCDMAGVHDAPREKHVRADLRHGLPYASGSMQGVVCSEVLEHLLEPATAIHELSRVLAPGGVLVFSVPNYWNLHRRFRYFMTGSLQRCYCRKVSLEGPHGDECLPHVNTATFETYSFILRRCGVGVEDVRGVNSGGFFRALPYGMLGLIVKVVGALYGKRGHPEINAWPLLVGRHACVVGRKR